MRHVERGWFAALLMIGLTLGSGIAMARELHWSSFRVTARLDAEGVLHVAERQAMVFTGDWNGGERGFRVGGGLDVELVRLTRIEPSSGARVELVEGDLDRVDHYEWIDGATLRWRSRLPSEPPFERTTLIYLIEYRLNGVLFETEDVYRLDHDFAFPERPGVIESFSLDLELDPVWSRPEGLPAHLERSDIPPGRSVVLTAELDYLGEGRPSGVARRVPRSWIDGIFFVVLVGFGAKCLKFWRNESAQGRYETVDVPTGGGADWLEEHVLGLLPEQAGALWDRKVGPAEVAAVLARMVAEGKLASRTRTIGKLFKRPVLELDLEVDRSELEGYERKLIDKLFFGGRSSTDTELVREHYKSTGFRPVEEIRAPIERELKRIPDLGDSLPGQSPRITGSLLLAFLVLVVAEAVSRGPAALGMGLALVGITLVPVLLAYGFAAGYAKSIQHPHLASLGFLVPLLGVVGGAWLLARFSHLVESSGRGESLGVFGILATACWAAALVNSVLNAALTRDSRAAVRARQTLAGVRRRLADELATPQPYIRDEWFPYLLAFGLQRHVDRWFGSHGGETSTLVGFSGGGSSSSGRPVFTGGGGSFGGAGASATWAAAATGMGAGVSPPSSSGGSGGGGGGGSSGGGSGGGW